MNWLSWAILSAAFAGLTAILAKVGVKDVDSNLATAIRTSVILVFAWLVAWISNRQPLQSLTTRTWIFLALSGLATGASWLCYFRALQLGEASKVAPVDKLSVVVAMVLAVIFLGEALTWVHWLGGTLIVAGAVLLAYA
jgi:bacterial/archaeal transporter family protein